MIRSQWIPVLCYHRVCPPEEGRMDSPSLIVSPQRFRSQMRLLKVLGYHSISPQEMVAYKNHRKNPPSKPVLLTFDDGYEDNFKYAFPILKEFSFTATIFLVTDGVGKKNFWDSKTVPLLNESEMKEMHLSGIHFGSHTMSHVDLSQVPPEVLKYELKGSYQKLVDWTSRLDIPFCYPYTRLKEEAKREVQQAGYLCAFSGDNGFTGKEDLFELMRIQVFPSTSLFGFWMKLQSWYPSWRSYSFFKR